MMTNLHFRLNYPIKIHCHNISIKYCMTYKNAFMLHVKMPKSEFPQAPEEVTDLDTVLWRISFAKLTNE